jgi:Fe2+ transport system protein FeoA
VRLIRRVDVGGVLEVEVRGCRLSVRHGEARQLAVEPG